MFATVQSEIYAKPGELLQGALNDHIPFLLSNRSSRLFKTTTTLHPDKVCQSVLHAKSKQAIQVFMETLEDTNHQNLHPEKHITQQSNIPVGKGLSSSSADILGILQVLSVFYKTHYSSERLYQLASQIEPTDPCLNPGTVLFQQQQGTIMTLFPDLPFRMLYFDSEPERQIDTIDLSKSICYTHTQCLQFEEIKKKITSAFETKNYSLFYHCLNLSAEINNTLLPKKNIHYLQDFAFQHKVGLFVAHSGTYMGLVMSPETESLVESKAMNFINKHWNTPIYIE